MKKAILSILLISLLCSFKGDITVNPDYLGTWRCVRSVKDKPDKINVLDWNFKQNEKANKIDIYRKKDADGQPFCTVKMEDETHFKGKSKERIDENVTVEHFITGYLDNKKFVIADHELKCVESGGNTIKHPYDFKGNFRRMDVDKNKYIDFPDFPTKKILD